MMRMGQAVLNVLATAERRGAETFAYELSNALSRRGFRSDAVSLVRGATDGPLPVPVLGDSRYSGEVLRALRRRAKDSGVVIGHGSSTLVACSVAMLALPVPFVYVNIGDPRHWASTPGRRLRVRSFLRRAKAVVAISPGSRDLLITEFGLAPARIWVIPNARSAEQYHPPSRFERLAARSRLRLPVDGTVLASVGALSSEKRADVAVRALTALPDAMLVIAGDGPERPALEALAASVAPGRVRFLGSVPAVMPVLAAADVLVHSSDSEGVPGILIEAGLAGVPVVATDVGFVRDVVVPGATGELVRPGQPNELASMVDHVLTDQDSYGSKARAHCLARFEIAAVADRWEELLAAVRR